MSSLYTADFSLPRNWLSSVWVIQLSGISLRTLYSLTARNLPGGTSGKKPARQCRRHKRCGFSPWIRKIPWRRARQPTPVFLPGESHIQRSLVGYSSQGFKESDMTEKWPSMHFWRDTIDRNWNLFQKLTIWLEFLYCVSIRYWVSNNIISFHD